MKILYFLKWCGFFNFLHWVLYHISVIIYLVFMHISMFTVMEKEWEINKSKITKRLFIKSCLLHSYIHSNALSNIQWENCISNYIFIFYFGRIPSMSPHRLQFHLHLTYKNNCQNMSKTYIITCHDKKHKIFMIANFINKGAKESFHTSVHVNRFG